VEKYYIIHPLPAQNRLVQQIIEYWQHGYGAVYNPDRKEAFSRVHHSNNLEEAIQLISQKTGKKVYTVATDAGQNSNSISYKAMKEKIFTEESVYLLLFGTGWGMTQELLNTCDYILEPVQGGSDYNHLSVRSAVSIIIDRLLGEFWYQS
jgi:hypothetical protein